MESSGNGNGNEGMYISPKRKDIQGKARKKEGIVNKKVNLAMLLKKSLEKHNEILKGRAFARKIL
jgi:hypothetical protein